ncbi:MAG: InlB B-repeat-containing protein, partial [Clostridia bacterium]|nr:InlB B-repeat-containing protein [Clostridia bacterium]
AKYHNGDKMFGVNQWDDTEVDHHERAYLVYQDGDKVDVTDRITHPYYLTDASDPTSKVLDTFRDLGLREVFIEYNGFAASYYVYVACEHQFPEDPQVVPATCKSMGYDLHVCELCGYYYRDNYVAPNNNHNVKLYTLDDGVIIDGIRPCVNAVQEDDVWVCTSCLEDGYTGDSYCQDCLKIINYGHSVAALGHTYDTDHCDNDVHYCVRCQAAEQHIWLNTESGSYLIETCGICGYQKEPQLKDLTNLPKVIVSSSYALTDSTVTVFVQLLNNPGITSVSFGIKYDERLQLVDWRQGNLLQNSVYSFKYGDSDCTCNFTSARAETERAESGNLIKLVFRTPKVAEAGDVYRILVCNSFSDNRFTDDLGEPIDIICFDGEVTITDHLPGDINGDEVVDIFDAVLIAEACNGSLAAEYQEACQLYGDVNFDGSINNADMVRILRYLVGGYNCQLLADEFKVVLNHNDGENAPTTLVIKKGDTYGDVLDMVSRLGYRFEGWYDQADGGNAYNAEDTVKFDLKQFERTQQQVFYAHWDLNQITYDTGDPSHAIDSANYQQYKDQGGLYEINGDLSTTVTIRYIDSDSISNHYDQTVTFGLIGWATQQGSTEVKFYCGEQIDLATSDPNLATGQITLYPVWKHRTITLPATIPQYVKEGYVVEKWCEHNDGTGNQYAAGTPFTVDADMPLYAKWEEITYTVVFDANGGGVDDLPEAVTVKYSQAWNLPSIHPTKDRCTFMGWTTKTLPIKRFRKDAAFETTYMLGNVATPYITEQNQLITLYAVWNDDVYYDTVYDFVYFGTYPQTLVSEESVIDALNQAAGDLPVVGDYGLWTSYDYYAAGRAQDYAWYIDLFYSGVQYRGVYFLSYRPFDALAVDAGEASQEVNGYETSQVYWFSYDPIKWNVVSQADGQALLVCDLILDSREVAVSGDNANDYSLSAIRSWLNDAFVETAFGDLQKQLLQVVTVDNGALGTNQDGDAIPWNGGVNDYACGDTQDKVFLLSVKEATAAYFGGDVNRIKLATAYAQAQGLAVDDGKADWWLRSPYFDDAAATRYIAQDGSVDNYAPASRTDLGILPAVCVTFDYPVWEHEHSYVEHDGEQCYCYFCQDFFHDVDANTCTCRRCNQHHRFDADCVCEWCGQVHDLDENCYCHLCDQVYHEVSNCTCTRCHATLHAYGCNYCRHGNIVYFGSYPQTLVTSTALSDALNELAGNLPGGTKPNNWTSYRYYRGGSKSNYMWYIDLTYHGVKYRGVYFNQNRPGLVTNTDTGRQGANGYETNTVYWFEFKPIQWRVLKSMDGNTNAVMIFCEMAIDSQEF